MRCPASTISGVSIVLPTAAADFGNAVPGANSATIAPTRGANKTFASSIFRSNESPTPLPNAIFAAAAAMPPSLTTDADKISPFFTRL